MIRSPGSSRYGYSLILSEYCGISPQIYTEMPVSNSQCVTNVLLQDPRQSELRLRPMTDKDRDQLKHLANLYSLTIHSNDDHTAPILTKTRYLYNL